MEIEARPKAFEPFKIRIESKEEAEVIFHLLNMDPAHSFSGYLLVNRIPNDIAEKIIAKRQTMSKKYCNYFKL
jgi:hypothetical protein